MKTLAQKIVSHFDYTDEYMTHNPMNIDGVNYDDIHDVIADHTMIWMDRDGIDLTLWHSATKTLVDMDYMFVLIDGSVVFEKNYRDDKVNTFITDVELRQEGFDLHHVGSDCWVGISRLQRLLGTVNV